MAAEEVKFVFSMDDQFSQQAKKAESAAGGLQKVISNVGAGILGAFSLGAIKQFGAAVVESYGNMELFKTSLTTMLRGNAAEADALNDRLITLAKTTPFQLTDVQQGTKQLLAYGFEAGQLVTTMTKLGDVAAGVGAPLTDIAYLYGTLKTQDKVMSKDLYQFANRGIPIIEELAKKFKVAKGAIFDMASAGKIGFKDVEVAFNNMTSSGGQFFNLMDTQSKTVKGQLSNLEDSWEQLKVSIGESQSGMIKSSISWAQQIVQDITDVYQAENRLEKAYAKGGVQQPGFFEKRGYMGLTDDKEKNDANIQLRDMWHENVNKAAESEAQLHRLYQQAAEGASGLINTYRRSQGDPSGAKMSSQDFLQQMAIIKDVESEISGSLDLLKSKNKGNNPVAANSAASVTSESDKTKSQKYTNITINIKDITGIGTLINKTEKEAGIISGEEISKYLVKGITDAQIVAGQ